MVRSLTIVAQNHRRLQNPSQILPPLDILRKSCPMSRKSCGANALKADDAMFGDVARLVCGHRLGQFGALHVQTRSTMKRTFARECESNSSPRLGHRDRAHMPFMCGALSGGVPPSPHSQMLECALAGHECLSAWGWRHLHISSQAAPPLLGGSNGCGEYASMGHLRRSLARRPPSRLAASRRRGNAGEALGNPRNWQDALGPEVVVGLLPVAPPRSMGAHQIVFSDASPNM